MIIHFKGFNTTLVQSKQYTENKIRTVDSAANENSKSINLVNQAIRKLERQVCTFKSQRPCVYHSGLLVNQKIIKVLISIDASVT